MRISSFVWVRLITLLSCLYVSKNGSVNAGCFPELWPAHCSRWKGFSIIIISQLLLRTQRLHSPLSALSINILSHLFLYSQVHCFRCADVRTPSVLFLSLSTHSHPLHQNFIKLFTWYFTYFIFSFFTHTSSLPKKWMKSFYYYSYHSNNLTV